jgi:hypothetical protein
MCQLKYIYFFKQNKNTFTMKAILSLDLMSTYEGEHTIFCLLSQANLTQNDVLQFHPFTSE